MCNKRPETFDDGAKVSKARESWCQPGLDCKEYLKKLVRDVIIDYSNSPEAQDFTYNLNIQYVLDVIENKIEDDKRFEDDTLKKSFFELFEIEFPEAKIYMELAKRECRPLDYYLVRKLYI